MRSRIDWQRYREPQTQLFQYGNLEGLVADELCYESIQKQLGNIEILLKNHIIHVYLHARNLIAAVRLDIGSSDALPSGMPKTIVVKRFGKVNTIQHILYSFILPSKALRSWTIAHHLIRSGLGTPQPLAIIETRQSGWLGSSYFITDQIQNYKTLRDLNKEPANEPGKKQVVIETLARYIHALHNTGVCHRDLTPRNFLFEEDDDHRYRICLVDLNRARIKNKVSVYRRIRDLARIKVCACPTDGQSLWKIKCGYDSRCERTTFLELYFQDSIRYRRYRFLCWLTYVLSQSGFRLRRRLKSIL